MNTETMFSSATGEWATPQDYFDRVNAEFGFELDAAATRENTKCKDYLSATEVDALNTEWTKWGHKSIWCNPPYGRGLGKWFEQARAAQRDGATVVLLVPARTDTKWFHEHVYNIATEIRFIKGRLKFGGQVNSAPFPSMLVIYRS